MMFPSLRGGNLNPGKKEGFLGEVDDIIAAADALAKVSYVDADRIYLGGHSTGGTLALLTAEMTPRFRMVFSFGPVEDIRGYGKSSGFLPFNMRNQKEVLLRSPGYWLHSVQSPVWIIEGTEDSGNIDSLREMAKVSRNPKVRFLEVKGLDHFSVLAPMNQRIAAKILQDTEAQTRIDLDTGISSPRPR